jgi:hypothetical protein
MGVEGVGRGVGLLHGRRSSEWPPWPWWVGFLLRVGLLDRANHRLRLRSRTGTLGVKRATPPIKGDGPVTHHVRRTAGDHCMTIATVSSRAAKAGATAPSVGEVSGTGGRCPRAPGAMAASVRCRVAGGQHEQHRDLSADADRVADGRACLRACRRRGGAQARPVREPQAPRVRRDLGPQRPAVPDRRRRPSHRPARVGARRPGPQDGREVSWIYSAKTAASRSSSFPAMTPSGPGRCPSGARTRSSAWTRFTS